ncbi:MAG TPA: hypothetical protein VEC36_13125 [Patescibacteria group bacterium]|nr:hypothetical protein [Patescibacteria group bacterium]
MQKSEAFKELFQSTIEITQEIIEILASTEALSAEELEELENLYSERGEKLDEFNSWYSTPEALAEIGQEKDFWNEQFLKLRETEHFAFEILKHRTRDTKESLRTMMQSKSVFLYTKK